MMEKYEYRLWEGRRKAVLLECGDKQRRKTRTAPLFLISRKRCPTEHRFPLCALPVRRRRIRVGGCLCEKKLSQVPSPMSQVIFLHPNATNHE